MIFALGFMAALFSGATYADGKTEVHVPFPKFSTRPSATTVYCQAVMSSELQGVNEKATAGKKTPANIAGVIDQNPESKLKLVFAANDVLVSIGLPASFAERYGPEFSYKILSDEPTDFFAILDRSKNGGVIQSLALNRVAGTMVWSSLWASATGHPSITSWFYVCSPNSA